MDLIHNIDLNCDLGESPGNQSNPIDEALLHLISSANIACGFHAGDALRMEITVAAAKQHGVAIGAHPGFEDKENFGRIPMPISPREAYQLVLYQVGALSAFLKAADASLHHVKLHGALYNMVAQDRALSESVVQAILDFDPKLKLYALAGSVTVEIARKNNLSVAQEGFADRRYNSDGGLVSRQHPDALITNTEEAVQQSIDMIKRKTIRTIEGSFNDCQIDTICLHGDGAHALEFAQQLRQQLLTENINICAPK